MKNEKGVTLIALVLYIIIFTATMILLASLSNFVYNNMSNINSNSVSSEEFNKFNVNFVKDVKESKTATVTSNSNEVIIAFESGNVYTYKTQEKSIYKNKEKIATNILSFTAETTTENSKKIVKVGISTGKDVNNPNYSKTIKYVLKYW